ncbi:hypothetical protein [Glutamicibacter sp. TV12E]|uniref:hypothetical protein n=1 Tax=Glutamicibacter sp. TV12E TaxID=3446362 RepID=UPI004034614D
MKPGIINLAKINHLTQRDAISEWLLANGVRHLVPSDSRVIITGNKFTVEVYDHARLGQKNRKWSQKRRNGQPYLPIKTRTYRIRVPLQMPERGQQLPEVSWKDEHND